MKRSASAPGGGFVMVAVASTLLLLTGCEATWQTEHRTKPDLGVEPVEAAHAGSAAYRDTIGAISFYEGMGPMRVRGYGLVVGLGTNGSRDCPKPIYDQIVQNFYKQHRPQNTAIGERAAKPEDIINSVDSAVVVVQGDIPPAAVRGTRFDVTILALPGTQTKSLVGGRLLTTDLEVYRETPDGATISGQFLAKASGPVFINPFADDGSATRSNPRQALVLGGGRAVEDRRLRLVLIQPSHQAARRIQDRINARFPDGRKVADAVSPSFVQLQVPEDFREDAGHFIALARSLYLNPDPSFEAARSRDLGRELADPTAPHGQIALALEGIGRISLPVVSELYTHPKEYAAFHAAVAGLRLGDHLAADVMTQHAGNAESEYQFQAIRALGEAKSMGATAAPLRALLNADDPRVRTAAYEALRRRGDYAIHSRRVGRDNFTMEVIPGVSSPFLYVRRTEEQRIAIFGDDIRCTPPILYRAPDGCLTITARVGDEHLTLMRTVVGTGTTSPPIPAPFELMPLIELLGSEADINHKGTITGLGLDYAAVVRAIHQLSVDQAIAVPFILEQPNVAELFGPAAPSGRSESEL